MAEITDKEKINACLDLTKEEHGVTDWEVGFIDSVDKRERRGGSLTERQVELVDQVYRERVLGEERRK